MVEGGEEAAKIDRSMTSNDFELPFDAGDPP